MMFKIFLLIFILFVVFLAWSLCVAAGNADRLEEQYWSQIESKKEDDKDGEM